MAQISRNQAFDWWMAVAYMEKAGDELVEKALPEAAEGVRHTAAVLSNLEKIADRIRGLMPKLPVRTNTMMHACLVAIQGAELFQKIGAWVIAGACHTEPAIEVDGKKLAAELEEWFMFYKEVWRSVSRESELYRIQDIVFRYADLLRK